MSDGKRDRNPFEDRYGGSESEESSETSKSGESEKESDSSKTSVRERKNVNMYLPEGVVDELQLAYAELNVAYRREHGEDMPKNDVFYPHVIRAALSGESVEDMLDLDE